MAPAFINTLFGVFGSSLQDVLTCFHLHSYSPKVLHISFLQAFVLLLNSRPLSAQGAVA